MSAAQETYSFSSDISESVHMKDRAVILSDSDSDEFPVTATLAKPNLNVAPTIDGVLTESAELRIDTPDKATGKRAAFASEDDVEPSPKKLCFDAQHSESKSQLIGRLLKLLFSTSQKSSIAEVQKEVVKYSEANSSESYKHVWRMLRSSALHLTLKELLPALDNLSMANPTQDANSQLSSGVCWVRKSESETLPHVVIRPSSLVEYPGPHPTVNKAVYNVLTQPTTTVTIPWCGDAFIRDYLLHPAHRNNLMHNEDNHISQTTSTGAKLASLLHDRVFVCLHYCCVVTESGAIMLETCYKVELSDVAIGVLVRKGVGGTGSLRIAERALHQDTHPEFELLVNDSLGTSPVESIKSSEQTPPANETAENATEKEQSEQEDNARHHNEHGGEEADEDNGEGGEDVDEDTDYKHMSVSTYSCRIDMYTSESKWATLNTEQRNILFSIIRQFERELSSFIQVENRSRLKRCCLELNNALDAGDGSFSKAEERASSESDDDESSVEYVPNMKYENALVKAAACLLAAPSCGFSSSNLKVPWPLYLISTRDCFSHELIPINTTIQHPDGRTFTKTEWYIHKDATAEDTYWATTVVQKVNDSLLPVGITTYSNSFSENELREIENQVDDLDAQKIQGRLPETCYSQSRGRTKFFFGSRYIWGKGLTGVENANIAAGVRVDVPPVPSWVTAQIEKPLHKAGVIREENFANACALNIYHDGSEGIQSHFDDARRFDRPIYSLRLFSDSRLSFGGVRRSNHMFYVPLQRGTVCVMDGYAANRIKHCVRSFDLASKSAGLMLRRVSEPIIKEANAFHYEETIDWFKALGLEGYCRRLVHFSDISQRVNPVRGYNLNAKERKLENDQVQVKLLLADMVDKVEAAERCNVSLKCAEDTVAFTLLHNMISCVECLVND